MTEANERAAKASEKLAASAGTLETSAIRQTDTADRRTELAADRTRLAAERTYAAWVRTGLAALAAGIGARALLDKIVPDLLIIATGSVLVVFSGFCFGAAVWREVAPGISPTTEDIRRLPTPLLIVINGFLMLVSLAALVGIWRR